jgi:hypothetical protein
MRCMTEIKPHLTRYGTSCLERLLTQQTFNLGRGNAKQGLQRTQMIKKGMNNFERLRVKPRHLKTSD